MWTWETADKTLPMDPEEDRPRSQVIFLTLHTHFVSTQGSFQASWSLFWSNFLAPFDIPSYLTTLLSSSFLPFLHIPLPAGSSIAPGFISGSTIKQWSEHCWGHKNCTNFPFQWMKTGLKAGARGGLASSHLHSFKSPTLSTQRSDFRRAWSCGEKIRIQLLPLCSLHINPCI